MKCKRCLYGANHALGITFNQEGICSGCVVHEEKHTVEWEQKFLNLKIITDKYRNKEGYDCIVPVTSSSDSYFVLHQIVNVLKLNPLVVTYNKYYNNDLSIQNLARLREIFGIDIIFKNVNINKIKNITRYSLERYGNPYWHVIAGSTVFPVQVSVMFKVPLIVWGAHQGIEQVGMYSYNQNVEMSRRYRKDIDLYGKEKITEGDLFSLLNDDSFSDFRYPADKELLSAGTRGIFLNNYICWDYRKNAEFVVDKYGFQTLKSVGSFDIYENVDCYVYLNLHNKLKYLKHGYSKVTDQLCREIRHGRISRSDALVVEKAYLNKWNDHEQLFCDWLGISATGLDKILNFHKNYGIVDVALNRKERDIVLGFESTYVSNSISFTSSSEPKYVYFGKGV
jgi:N-acetyl sugar amidotransferase